MGAMRRVAAALAALALAGVAAGQAPAGRPAVPTSSYATRRVQGWTVRVNRALLDRGSATGRAALALLDAKLFEIGRVVPAKALARLREVTIWLGVEDGHAPCAEYHPNRDWLAANGYNPEKAKGVEIGSASRFVEWSRDQPAMVLHELAHAYHDRVLGFEHAGIAAAWRAAAASGAYDRVLHASGRTERAYALTDEHEYFAECTEAWFLTNDFYPFVRAELRRTDPGAAALLERLWGG